MNRNKILKYALAAAVIMPLAACNDDKYQPGPKTDPNSPGVVFDQSNPGTFVIPGTSDSYDAAITLTRSKTEGELTVPIDVKDASSLLAFTPQVHFADGQASTQMQVKLSAEAKRSTRYTLQLALPENLTDNYTLSGTSTLAASLVVVDPFEANCYLGDNTEVGTGIQTMFQIDDYEYYFTDFLHTGYEMTFMVDPSSLAVTPVGPLVGDYEADDGYGVWYVEGPMYIDPSAKLYIDAMYIYSTYTEYFDWGDGLHGIYMNVYIYYSDGSAAYDYLYFEFPEFADNPGE